MSHWWTQVFDMKQKHEIMYDLDSHINKFPIEMKPIIKIPVNNYKAFLNYKATSSENPLIS